MLKISEDEMQEFCRHAMEEYPKECCGILLGNKETRSVQKIHRARNVAAIDRQNIHFLINPLELYRVEREAEKKNMEIVGFYHSHVDYPSVLSMEDQSFMIQECMYMVISVMNGVCRDIKCFILKGDKTPTSIGGELQQFSLGGSPISFQDKASGGLQRCADVLCHAKHDAHLAASTPRRT